jgi:tetratricopeptide (TPR) repeat protein
MIPFLQPPDPNRADNCINLATSLYERYKEAGDITLLDEAIKLEREALALRPPGDPYRVNICDSLGTSLQARYKHAGDIVLLDEAIELGREGLALQPPGHPDRSNSCDILSVALCLRYDQTGDGALLDEGIELLREALAVQPTGHPYRARSCSNLGSLLKVRYEETGDVTLLDEAVELGREALMLRPPGHPDRAFACHDYAGLLLVRYRHTSDREMLYEAIELTREALALLPSGHPQRVVICGNLGCLLSIGYEHVGGGVAMLDEAIELEREALALEPPGHPDRSNSCINLAASLYKRWDETGHITLLDEAIELSREALALQSPGHPDRVTSCTSLAVALCMRYKQTGDVAVLDEALDTCSYAAKHSSASLVWYPLTQLSYIHLAPGSPHYSPLEALGHLHRAFQHEVDDIHDFISQVCSNIRLIWNDSTVWSPHVTALLVNVYTQLIDRLPRLAGFVLNASSRLRTLGEARQVGSDACVAAILAQQPATAVTLLDRALGVVWTQALHQRDPQTEGAPQDLAIELEDLLRALAISESVDSASLPDYWHCQDLRHRQNVRIQAILRDIRAMPGLVHFMLGSTYETLCEAARDHPIVVLVAARDRAFALIMPSSSHAGPDILRLNVTSDSLQSFANSIGQTHLRYRAGSAEHRRMESSGQDVPHAELTDQERAMRTGNFGSEWSPLASLWRDVVKPVLTHLHLAVRHPRIVPSQY